MATKVHAIETVLSKALVLKRGKDSEKAFAEKLFNAAAECDAAVWEGLPEEAQQWYDAGVTAREKDKDADLPPYEGADEDEPEAEEYEAEEYEAEEAPAKTAKKAAPKKAKTPPAKEAKGKAPAPKAKATAPKKAASKGNGTARKEEGEAVGMTDGWRKVLGDVGKKGDKGVDSAGMVTLCDKHGVRPYYARFVRAGYLTRVERGTYALSKSGAKAVAAASA